MERSGREQDWLTGKFKVQCIPGKATSIPKTTLDLSLGEGLMLKLKLQFFGHLMRRSDSSEKDPDAGKDWGWEKGTTEDEMVGWHHRLNGHEFE